MRMLDRQQLEAFAAVIEHKSFERAAAVLNITRGAVSQRIKSLEQYLSTILVVRERPIHPTSAGRALLQHISALRTLEMEVFRSLPNETPALSQVAIGVHPDSLITWFAPLLLELMQTGKLCVEVIADDRCHGLDLLTRGEVHGCVSTASKALDGFAARPLGVMEYYCVSTASFAQKYLKKGVGLHTLLNTPAITRDRKDTKHNEFLRTLLGVTVERFPCHYLPSSQSSLDAVLADIGYALVPAILAQPLLETGELVNLTAGTSYKEPLYWHSWSNSSIIDHVIGSRILETAQRTLQPAAMCA